MDEMIPNDDLRSAKELQKHRRKQEYQRYKKFIKEQKQAEKEAVLEQKKADRKKNDQLLWDSLSSGLGQKKTLKEREKYDQENSE